MKIYSSGNHLVLDEVSHLDIALTLDCGQAFRWAKNDQGQWEGIVNGVFLRLSQSGNQVTLYDTSEKTFNKVWKPYFDLDRDYESIISSYTDESLITACREYPGIRILKQDEWEAICSFIISANNNIPRIKGIIQRFCQSFGNDTGNGYSFPTAERVAHLTVEDLAPIRAGFRAKYIIDAAQKCTDGGVDLEALYRLPTAEAAESLKSIKGIGDKVAACSLLFGFGKLDAFPVDVWIKKVIARYFGDDFTAASLGPYAGVAQQFLFYYERWLGGQQ